MELEEAIKYFENFTNYTKDVWKKEQKEKFDKKYEQDLCKRVKMFELLLKYIKEESIPKAVLKKEIEEIKGRKMDIVTSPIHSTNEKLEILEKDQIRKDILQEILKESK